MDQPIDPATDGPEGQDSPQPSGHNPAAPDDPADDAATSSSDDSSTAEESPDGPVLADDSAPADNEKPIDPGQLEALLFSTHHPLTAGRLAELANSRSTAAIRRALRTLNEQYEQTGRCFRVEQVAGGYQLLTLPEFGPLLQSLHHKEADAKLSRSAMETLAIIAYRQPILRADVEAIRGVACGETLRSLMEKRLVKITGRAEVPGRPILYGTTKRFLETFGLNSLKDLPQSVEGLRPVAEGPSAN